MAKAATAAEAATKISRREFAEITKQFTKAERAKAQQTIAGVTNRLSSPSLGNDEIHRLEAERRAAAEDLAYTEMRRAKDYQTQIAILSAERDRLEREAFRMRAAQTSFEDGEAKRILDFWAVHFPRISFDRQAVRWVVHKHHRERLSLEGKLMELNQSDDPAALSLGKMRMSGEHHLRFKLGQVECRMYYKVSGQEIQVVSPAGVRRKSESY